MMKPFDKVLFLLLGVVLWIAGTIWYGFRGAYVFESTAERYWINFTLTPIVTSVICVLFLKLRHTPAADWAFAALLVALPGLVGEAVLLSRFQQFMPRMRPESAGRYGAFLFATYALFLTIAEIVTVRAGGR
jgi:Mn2+/Fe2+ NRAMP family transporter